MNEKQPINQMRENRIIACLTIRAIEIAMCVLVALSILFYMESRNIRYDIPFEKVMTIDESGKFKALKGCIVILRDKNDLRNEEKELKIKLPERMLRKNIIVVTYNYDIGRIGGGFTAGRDEIDVQRMKYKWLGAKANKINIYKIKRSLYYR